MSEPVPSRRPARRVALVAAAIALLALALAAGLASQRRADDPPAPPAPAIAATARVERPAPPPHRTSTSPEAPLAPGARLTLTRAELPAAGPVVVYLELPAASRDPAPRAARLVSQPDHRILELRAPVSGERAAVLEIDPAYLTPATYLVEVMTAEPGHLPLRRYAIVVGE